MSTQGSSKNSTSAALIPQFFRAPRSKNTNEEGGFFLPTLNLLDCHAYDLWSPLHAINSHNFP